MADKDQSQTDRAPAGRWHELAQLRSSLPECLFKAVVNMADVNNIFARSYYPQLILLLASTVCFYLTRVQHASGWSEVNYHQ